MAQRTAQARLGPVDELDLRPVFQPIVDLRDGAVVGYEALVRGRDDAELHSAQALLAAARREDSMLALDLAARDAALQAAEEAGLDAPFSLFLNADPATLDGGSPERPSTRLTLVVEVTEQALIAHPEALLRALTRLGHRARRRRRRLALARVDVAPLPRRDQARPAAPRRAPARGARADRDRGRRRGGAAARRRAGGGDRLGGAA